LIPPKLRVPLAVSAFIAGTYVLIAGSALGLALLFVSALLAYGHFKYGTVWLAFREVARGRMDTAAQLLAQVKDPERLTLRDRAYFELAWGLLCASRAENDRAVQHLRSSLDHALPTENDCALAEAVLSQLLIARGALDEARTLIARAATRQCRPAIAERIKAIQAELSQR